MKLPALSLLILAIGAAEVPARDPSLARFATVRIPSHGCSGTVISTGPGRSLILSCAHAFKGADRFRPLSLDIQAIRPGPPRRVGVRLLAVDEAADLSLIEVLAGPLDYVCPVAASGLIHPRTVLSAGYDEMRSTLTAEAATILITSNGHTLTRERPRHGRSGGPLIDPVSGCLIGVVKGYEDRGYRRGVYVSLDAVQAFLGRSGVTPAAPA